MPTPDYKRNDAYQSLFLLDALKNSVLKQHFTKEKTVLLIRTKSAYNLLRLTI